VTMFHTKNKPMNGIPGYQSGVYGGTIPAEIWKNFMLRVTQNMPPEPFPVPTFAGNRQLWDSPPPQTPKPTPGVSSGQPTPTPGLPGIPQPTESDGPILPGFPRPSDSNSPSPGTTKSREANDGTAP
jgi:membrane peptidoglycan carboxypeptidase